MQSQENNSDLLGSFETAQYLNITMSLLRKLVFRNEIPYLKIGAVLKFSKSDLDQWVNNKKFYEFG